jgi:tetratricopeptide (TPR) repeat protein
MRWALPAVLLLAAPDVSAQALMSEELGPVVEAFQLVESWRIDEARDRTQALYEAKPDDPYTLALMGIVKMHMSDFQGAVELMREAREKGAPGRLVMDEGLAEAARVATDGYQEAHSAHFVIRYVPGRDEILVPYAIETLEAAYQRIGGLLGWQPEGRVALELYPSAKTLAQVSSLTEADIENSGTIALCRWNRLMATTPRAVVFGYSWRDTLSHELTHLIIGGASKNTVPIWLHEGIAKFAETAWRGEPGLGISVEQQERLRDAAKKGELIPFEKMHPSMAKLPTQEQTSLAFSEVFTFIEFLVERKGWEGMRQVLRLMADGKSDAEAIEAVHGMSLDALEKKWKKALPARAIKRPGGPVKGERPVELKADASVPDDELHGVSKEARRFARAADLLYARGRLKAAQTELQKAFDLTQSPLISAKLAMVALGNGDMAAAETAAKAAMEGAPALAGPNVTLAEVMVRVGKPEEAKAPLARAIDVNPFDPRIHHLTLATLGEGGDPAVRAHAERALALLQGSGKVRPPSLGKGGLVKVLGAPFARVYLRKAGGGAGSPWVPTGKITPTTAFSAKPGAYELMLLPPRGEATLHTVEVLPTSEDGQPQIIIPGATGS